MPSPIIGQANVQRASPTGALIGQPPIFNQNAMRNAALTRALLSAGAALMGQQPSRVPISPIASLGAGLQAGMQGAQAGRDDYLSQQSNLYKMSEMQNEADQKKKANDAWQRLRPTVDPDLQMAGDSDPVGFMKIWNEEAIKGNFAKPDVGKSLEERDDTTLRSGDPTSTEYAQAYYRQYLTPKMVQTEQGYVPIMPAVPPGIRKPAHLADAGAADASGTNGPTAGPIIPNTQKAPSDTERSAAGFADRMDKADVILGKIEASGGNTTASRGQNVLDSGWVPFGQSFESADYQSYKQAKDDWVRAKLRKESGAVIGAQEMTDEERTYFPQPGDGPDVITQKQKARKTAMDAMVGQAGNAYKKPAAAQPNGKYAEPKTQAEFDALPSGTIYHDPDDQPGVLRSKP